jgi:Domain of unknown function (DUF4471)
LCHPIFLPFFLSSPHTLHPSSCSQTATELTAYNVLSFLWELETGRRYVLREAHEIYSGLGREIVVAQREGEREKEKGKEKEEGEKEKDGEEEEGGSGPSHEEQVRALRRARTIAASLRGVCVAFLSGDLEDWTRRRRLAGVVDCVVVSMRGVDVLGKAGFAPCLRERASVMLETARNAVGFDQRQKDEFERRAASLAVSSLGCQFVSSDRGGLVSDARVLGSAATDRPRLEPGAMKLWVGAPRPPPRNASEASLVDRFGAHGELVVHLKRAANWPVAGGDNPRAQWLGFLRSRTAAAANVAAFAAVASELHLSLSASAPASSVPAEPAKKAGGAAGGGGAEEGEGGEGEEGGGDGGDADGLLHDVSHVAAAEAPKEE